MRVVLLESFYILFSLISILLQFIKLFRCTNVFVYFFFENVIPDYSISRLRIDTKLVNVVLWWIGHILPFPLPIFPLKEIVSNNLLTHFSVSHSIPSIMIWSEFLFVFFFFFLLFFCLFCFVFFSFTLYH